MALFGSRRDILVFTGVNQELIENVISTQIGYYKIQLSSTSVNVYGESMNKTYIGPVLLNCLIERGDTESVTENNIPNVTKPIEFRFLKTHLIEASVVPEIGDIIMFNENYYEVDNVNENQFLLGKDPDYSYSDGLDNFGSSFSIICSTHYTNPNKLNITK